MRRWIAPYRFVLLTLLGSATGFVSSPMAQSESQTAALDALFEQLKSAPDETAARAITEKIWVYWTTPPDPQLAADIQQVLMLRQHADFAAALALLDTITVDYPSYAEGWNQRATIYYLLGNNEKSLADIDKVLEFEPRHFGALVGRAVIHKNRGEDDLARDDMVRALAIHPFLVERAMFPELVDLINI